MTRGYFGVGIIGAKTPANVGTLWRSAANFGAAFMFTVGHRYPRQGSDTVQAWKHVPLFQIDSLDDLPMPKGCPLIGVEQAERSRPLVDYRHPERAVYLLGAEDHGIPDEALARCQSTIAIDTPFCLNVAVAGSIVMYDRHAKA